MSNQSNQQINIYEVRVYFQSNIAQNQPKLDLAQIEEYQKLFGVDIRKDKDQKPNTTNALVPASHKYRDASGNPLFLEAGKVVSNIQTNRQYQLKPDMLNIGKHGEKFYVTDQLEMSPSRPNIQSYRYFTDQTYLRQILERDLYITTTGQNPQQGKGKTRRRRLPHVSEQSSKKYTRKRSAIYGGAKGAKNKPQQPQQPFPFMPQMPYMPYNPYGQPNLQYNQQLLNKNIETMLNTFLIKKSTPPRRIVIGLRAYTVDSFKIMNPAIVPRSTTQPVNITIQITLKPYTGEVKVKAIQLTQNDRRLLKIRNDIVKRCNPKRDKIKKDWDEIMKQILNYGKTELEKLEEEGKKRTIGIGVDTKELHKYGVIFAKLYNDKEKEEKAKVEEKYGKGIKPAFVWLSDNEINQALKQAGLDTSTPFLTETIYKKLREIRGNYLTDLENAKTQKDINQIEGNYRAAGRSMIKRMFSKLLKQSGESDENYKKRMKQTGYAFFAREENESYETYETRVNEKISELIKQYNLDKKHDTRIIGTRQQKIEYELFGNEFDAQLIYLKDELKQLKNESAVSYELTSNDKTQDKQTNAYVKTIVKMRRLLTEINNKYITQKKQLTENEKQQLKEVFSERFKDLYNQSIPLNNQLFENYEKQTKVYEKLIELLETYLNNEELLKEIRERYGDNGNQYISEKNKKLEDYKNLYEVYQEFINYTPQQRLFLPIFYMIVGGSFSPNNVYRILHMNSNNPKLVKQFNAWLEEIPPQLEDENYKETLATYAIDKLLFIERAERDKMITIPDDTDSVVSDETSIKQDASTVSTTPIVSTREQKRLQEMKNKQQSQSIIGLYRQRQFI